MLLFTVHSHFNQYHKCFNRYQFRLTCNSQIINLLVHCTHLPGFFASTAQLKSTLGLSRSISPLVFSP